MRTDDAPAPVALFQEEEDDDHESEASEHVSIHSDAESEESTNSEVDAVNNVFLRAMFDGNNPEAQIIPITGKVEYDLSKVEAVTDPRFLFEEIAALTKYVPGVASNPSPFIDLFYSPEYDWIRRPVLRHVSRSWSGSDLRCCLIPPNPPPSPNLTSPEVRTPSCTNPPRATPTFGISNRARAALACLQVDLYQSSTQQNRKVSR